jgi:hypothetical protein
MRIGKIVSHNATKLAEHHRRQQTELHAKDETVARPKPVSAKRLEPQQFQCGGRASETPSIRSTYALGMNEIQSTEKQLNSIDKPVRVLVT